MKRSKLYKLCYLCFFALSLVFFIDLPNTYAIHLADVRTVRVGYVLDAFSKQDESQGYRKYGYSYEYLQTISNYTGWNYEYVYGDWSTLYKRFLNGEIDMMIKVDKRPEREEEMLFSSLPMGTDGYFIIVMEDDEQFRVEDFSTFEGKRIGASNLNSEEDCLRKWLNANNINAEIVIYNDEKKREEDIKKGVIDAFVADNTYIDSIFAPIVYIGSANYFAVFKKGRYDLLYEYNDAQQAIFNSIPHYNETLYNKYYTEKISNKRLTAGEKRWISKADSLRVGCLVNDLPFSDYDFLRKEGKGIIKVFIDNMIRLLSINDLDVVYVPYYSYPEMLTALSKGEVDVAFPVLNDLWRAELRQIVLTDPLMNVSMAVIFKPPFGEEKLKNMGVPTNRLAFDYVMGYYPKSNMRFYSSTEKCLQDLLDNKVNAIVAHTYKVRELVYQRKLNQIASFELPDRAGICFALKRGERELLTLFNRATAVMPKEKVEKEILSTTVEEYFYTAEDFISDNASLLITVFVSFMVVMGALVYSLISHRKLKSFSTRLATTNDILEDKIEKEKEMKVALEAAFDAANRANQAKTDFLSAMSHDIRTPMNGIVGMTAIALSNITDSVKVNDCLKKISSASKHLLNLINDILDMSRIESGRIQLKEVGFNLPDEIDTIVKMIETNMNEKKQNLTLITNIEHENVVGDNLHLRQLLLNILGNACKYTPNGGKISFSVIECPSQQPRLACYEFVCEDNGIGMSEEYLNRIYEPFTRETVIHKNKIQGTGLGMAISRNIVRMMGGDISVESTVGMGTKFTVMIYLKLDDDIEINNEALKEDFKQEKVLLVDFDYFGSEATKTMLTSLFLETVAINTPQEVLNELKENKGKPFTTVILVVNDENEIDMLDLAIRIRKEDTLAKLKLFIADFDWTDYEERARASGIDGFISRPFFKSRFVKLFGAITSSNNNVVKDETPFGEISAMNLAGKRALLAEDNELNAEIAKEIFTVAGLEVEWAIDGELAVDMFKAHENGYYDIIFMDIQMPNMNGYEATAMIRAIDTKYAQNIPIIAMTANVFAEDKSKSKAVGMNEHVAKPIDLEELNSVLRKWL